MKSEDLDGIPSSPKWSSIGKFGLSDLRDIATGQHGWVPRWVPECYNWICGRHRIAYGTGPKPITEYGSKGPTGQVPILLYDQHRNEGGIAFLSVSLHSMKPETKTQDAFSAAQGAASWLAGWLARVQAFDSCAGWPVIDLDLDENDDGTSVGLSAFLATLHRLLGLELAGDVCATGVWRPGDGRRSKGRLAPVPERSLKPKAEAARRWGYGRLVVVQGQRGVNRIRRLFKEVIKIPQDPRSAALSALEAQLEKDAPDRGEGRKEAQLPREWPTTRSEAMMKVLAAYDRGAVRAGTDERKSCQTVFRQLKPWTAARHVAMVRHFAHDIRARAALHAGRAVVAKKEADAAKRLTPRYTLDGWISDYLDWHQPAHRAVVEIDDGNWDDECSIHAKLKRKIEKIRDHNPRRPGLLYAQLALNNTFGMLRLYQGRLAMDRDLVREAWTARLAVKEHWAGLFYEYCRKLGIRDGTMRRQHNYCLDVITSWWELTGKLPGWDYPKPFFFEEVRAADINAKAESADRLDAFDIASVLRWQGMKRNPRHAHRLRHSLGKEWVCQAARWLKGKSHEKRRPNAMVAEAVLRFTKPGEHVEEAKVACDFLKSVVKSDTRGIRGVIVLRACGLLKMHGCRIPWPKPPKGRRLRRLFSDLKADEKNLLIRCPY